MAKLMRMILLLLLPSLFACARPPGAVEGRKSYSPSEPSGSQNTTTNPASPTIPGGQSGGGSDSSAGSVADDSVNQSDLPSSTHFPRGIAVMTRPSRDTQYIVDNPGVKLYVTDFTWAETAAGFDKVRSELDHLPQGTYILARLLVTGYSVVSDASVRGGYRDPYTPASALQGSSVIVQNDPEPSCNIARLDYVAKQEMIATWVDAFAREFADDPRLAGLMYGIGVAGEALPWVQTLVVNQGQPCQKQNWADAYISRGYASEYANEAFYGYVAKVYDAAHAGWKKPIIFNMGSNYFTKNLGPHYRAQLMGAGSHDTGLRPDLNPGARNSAHPRSDRFFYKPGGMSDLDFDYSIASTWQTGGTLGWDIVSGWEPGGSSIFEFLSLRGSWQWMVRHAIGQRSTYVGLWAGSSDRFKDWGKVDPDILELANNYLGLNPQRSKSLWINFRGRSFKALRGDFDHWFDNYLNDCYGLKTDLELADRWDRDKSIAADTWAMENEYANTELSGGTGLDDWRYYTARYVQGNILVDVEDAWPLGENGYDVSLIYLNDSVGRINIYYTSATEEKLLMQIEKTGAGGWERSSMSVSDIVFRNGISPNLSSLPTELRPQVPGFDLRISDGGDGRDLISELKITRK